MNVLKSDRETCRDQLAVTAIRMLSIDMVERANSGHPGMPMGAAPMAYELWTRHMRHNPANPHWFDRDRFILSAGHGSALLYSLLHLFGYGLPLEELQRFRQWGSKTPGHPEYGHTPGVDATTGPLGQGIAMAAGMAIAEAHLAAVYNRNGFDIINHHTFAICGDGDLMEGVSGEAASLAGHIGLGKLIVLYDSNDISLDGDLKLSFSENVLQRFQAYGWQTIRVEDGNNLEAISEAIQTAKSDANRPSLIEVRTVIGYGSPNKAGKSTAHGSPLGEKEIELTKSHYNWPHDPFHVPAEVSRLFASLREELGALERAWDDKFAAYRIEYPELASQLKSAIEGRLPAGWDRDLPVYGADSPKTATRESSGAALNALARQIPFLIGGSADLASSNNTTLKGLPAFSKENYSGRNIWFGVREFAMGAALNGISLHGGLRPFGGTFFVFSDYLRPAIRLSALMKQPVIYVLTHDSIAVGEDGPTHEPVEHLPSLRAMPGLIVFRPADANETTEAYRYALAQKERPVAMVLSRQKLPILEGTAQKARDGVAKGAYILSEPADSREAKTLLLATGSEVQLAVELQGLLADQGLPARVVSMPSWELFLMQPQSYRNEVLPPSIESRVAIEMASPLGWERFTGPNGLIVGIHEFGASAPGDRIIREYGFAAEKIARLILTSK